MDASPGSILLFLAFVALVAWRGYKRIRSLIGRQRLTAARPWVTVVAFPVALGLFAWATWLTHPENLPWLASGIAGGAGLAAFGLRKTDFEDTPGGLYYTPHSHIGLVLAGVLVARVGYRLVEIAWFGMEHGHGARDFIRTPLTLVVIGLLGGYFTAYSAGLLRWRARLRDATAGTGSPRSRS